MLRRTFLNIVLKGIGGLSAGGIPTRQVAEAGTKVATTPRVLDSLASAAITNTNTTRREFLRTVGESVNEAFKKGHATVAPPGSLVLA